MENEQRKMILRFYSGKSEAAPSGNKGSKQEGGPGKAGGREGAGAEALDGLVFDMGS